MPVTTGLVRIQPWDVVEVVTVRATETPDLYRVVANPTDLFSVTATDQSELIEKINKAWRSKFPKAR